MTENLLYKLEEKMMLVLSEVEELRKEVARLSQENSSMKTDKENHAKKLHDLIMLLEAVSGTENLVVNSNMLAVKPVLVQVENMQQEVRQ